MKLNNINKSAFLLISVLFLGCNSLLDIEAENSLSGNVFVSDQNFIDALNGAYVNLGGIYDGGDGGELYGGDLQLMATLYSRAKNTLFFWRASEAPSYQNFMDKDVLNINQKVESNWRRAYENINILNGILNNIANISDNTLRSRIEGEALAMRGMIYFELVRFWAPQYRASTANDPAVPIFLTQSTDVSELPEATLATVEQVYNQAINDLEAAEAILVGVNFDPARINVNVCRAVLSRIALQQNDFSRALGYLNQLIPNYSLTDNVMDAFNNSSISTEDVFIIQQNSESKSGNIATRTGLVSHLASLNGVGFAAMNINYEILESGFVENSPNFSSADNRYILQNDLNTNSSIADVNNNAAYYNDVINTKQVSSAKFLKTDANIPVIRLAELLLSRSEAALEDGGFVSPVTGTPLNDLNQIRTRSGLPALLDTLTADEFYDSLIVERNRELIFEGIYLHDLKRWSVNNRRTFSITFRDPLDERFILPIPRTECDATPGLCNN